MKKLNKYICLILLTIIFSTNTSAIVPQAERDALVALFNSTDGENWTDNSNWLVGDPCDVGWFGVTCGVETITKIIMLDNNISGVLPPEIGNLANLRDLKLQNNHIGGSIPSEIGGLTSLIFLRLEGNDLVGSIPEEIENLNLNWLTLSSNQLSGNIPAGIGDMPILRFLLLSGNKLSGEVPTSFENLTSLVSHDLFYNALHTDNQVIIDNFLSPFGDWQISQTLSPEIFQVLALSDNSISLKWSVPEYFIIDGIANKAGGYSVLMSENPDGPYTTIHTTISKSVVAYIADGLQANQTYYFKINTFTEKHNFNDNLVTSIESEIISATTSNTSNLSELSISIDIIQLGGFNTFGFILINNGQFDVENASFKHVIAHGLTHETWTCIVESGTALCPVATGLGNVDLLLNLPVNSSLRFNFINQIGFLDPDSALLVATITPPNNVSENNYNNNYIYFNLANVIFNNGFE